MQVMVRGGHWYSPDKHHDSFVAEGLRPNGVTTVAINYGLAPENRAALKSLSARRSTRRRWRSIRRPPQ